MNGSAGSASDRLGAAGLDHAAVAAWTAAWQEQTSDFEHDRAGYSQFWQMSDDLLGRLPARPQRRAAEADAANAVLSAARDHRERFLAAHGALLYDRLTRDRSIFVRIEALVFEAAAAVPGLTRTRQQVAAENARAQRDKDGIEIDQGIFLAHVLAGEDSGLHLCHAMLMPRPEAVDLLPKLAADGVVDLGKAEIARRG